MSPKKPLKNSLLLAFQYRPAKAVLHESIAYALDSCRVIPAPEKTSSFFRGFLGGIGKLVKLPTNKQQGRTLVLLETDHLSDNHHVIAEC